LLSQYAQKISERNHEKLKKSVRPEPVEGYEPGQTHLNSFDNNILGVRSDEFDVL